VSDIKFILHNMFTQDEFACAYPSLMMFTFPHDGQSADGDGLYGKHQFLTYTWGDRYLPGAVEWHIDVWQDSEGIHATKRTEE